MAEPAWEPTGYDGAPLVTLREAADRVTALRRAFPENVRSIGMAIDEDDCGPRLRAALATLHEQGLSIELLHVPFVHEDWPETLGRSTAPEIELREVGEPDAPLVIVSYQWVPSGIAVPRDVAFFDPDGTQRIEPEHSVIQQVLVALLDAGVPACVGAVTSDRMTPAEELPDDRPAVLVTKLGPEDEISLLAVETGIYLDYIDEGKDLAYTAAVIRRAHALGLRYEEARRWTDAGIDDAELAAWREQFGGTPAWPPWEDDEFDVWSHLHALPPDLMRLYAARQLGPCEHRASVIGHRDHEELHRPFCFSPVGGKHRSTVYCTAAGIERSFIPEKEEGEKTQTSTPEATAALLVAVGLGEPAQAFFVDQAEALRRSTADEAPATLATVDGLLAALAAERERAAAATRDR